MKQYIALIISVIMVIGLLAGCSTAAEKHWIDPPSIIRTSVFPKEGRGP